MLGSSTPTDYFELCFGSLEEEREISRNLMVFWYYNTRTRQQYIAPLQNLCVTLGEKL